MVEKTTKQKEAEAVAAMSHKPETQRKIQEAIDQMRAEGYELDGFDVLPGGQTK